MNGGAVGAVIGFPSPQTDQAGSEPPLLHLTPLPPHTQQAAHLRIMKRTRVDGQLSRLEYEEQEAAAPLIPSSADVSDDGMVDAWGRTMPVDRQLIRLHTDRAEAAVVVVATAAPRRRSNGRRPRRWRLGGW